MSSASEERRMILEMLEERRISAQEAEELLDALDRAGGSPEADEEPGESEGSKQPELDFGELGRGIREAVKGFTESFRKISGLPWEGDFREWFGAFMGGAKASVERAVSIPADAPRSRIRLITGRAALTVQGSDDPLPSGSARITAWAHDEASARKAAETVGVSAAVCDGVLEVRLSGAEERPREEGPRFAVDVTMRVPREAELTISAGSGDVVVSGTEGALELQCGSGKLRLLACRSSPLRIRSTSGDMEVELLERSSIDAELRAASGDITVRLSPSAALSVEATSEGGEVTVRAPLRVRELGRSRFVGELNAPDGRLRVQTRNGDIRIESLGD